MAASLNDKFTEATSNTRPVATTLTTQKQVGDALLSVQSVEGWATGTAVHFILYRLNSAGKKVPGSQTDWKGLVVNGKLTQIVLKAGNDDIYPIGSIVEAAPTAAWADDLQEGLLVAHLPTGELRRNAPVEGGGTIGELLPAGIVVPFGGINIPNGWLLCTGAPISRTTYAALFAAIGTYYGYGDTTTTFNLPDLRGRVVAGSDKMGGTEANRLNSLSGGGVGINGGSQTHTLSENEMPVHNHPGNTDTQGHHAHGTAGTYFRDAGGAGNLNMTGGGNRFAQGQSNVQVYGAGEHSHNVGTQNRGGGASHNNVQPTLIMNYIIKV